MATYLQAVKHLSQGERKRYLWVGGPERRLVEEIVDLYRDNVATEQRTTIDLETSPESELWRAIEIYPVERSLVIVRGAERIQNWDRFLDFEFEPIRGLHLCFVSAEDLTDTHPEHMRVLIKRGRFVRCGPFSKLDDAVTVLQLHRPIDRPAAELLIRRVPDVSTALNVLAMCDYFSPDEPVPYAVIERLVAPSPSEDYVEAVTELRARDATQATTLLAPGSYHQIIGLLDFRLNALTRLHDALRRTTDIGDLSRLTGLDRFVVRDLLRSARLYDHRRVQIAAEALQMVDARITEGETDMVLETLAVLWAA